MRTNFRKECISVELAAQHLKSHNDFVGFFFVRFSAHVTNFKL